MGNKQATSLSSYYSIWRDEKRIVAKFPPPHTVNTHEKLQKLIKSEECQSDVESLCSFFSKIPEIKFKYFSFRGDSDTVQFVNTIYEDGFLLLEYNLFTPKEEQTLDEEGAEPNGFGLVAYDYDCNYIGHFECTNAFDFSNFNRKWLIIDVFDTVQTVESDKEEQTEEDDEEEDEEEGEDDEKEQDKEEKSRIQEKKPHNQSIVIDLESGNYFEYPNPILSDLTISWKDDQIVTFEKNQNDHRLILLTLSQTPQFKVIMQEVNPEATVSVWGSCLYYLECITTEDEKSHSKLTVYDLNALQCLHSIDLQNLYADLNVLGDYIYFIEDVGSYITVMDTESLQIIQRYDDTKGQMAQDQEIMRLNGFLFVETTWVDEKQEEQKMVALYQNGAPLFSHIISGQDFNNKATISTQSIIVWEQCVICLTFERCGIFHPRLRSNLHDMRFMFE